MTRRDRMMLIAVLAVALLGGFWMVIVKPQRAAAKDAAAQVESAQATLTQAQQQVTTGKAAQAAYRRDRSTFVKLGRVVPESDDIPTLLTQMQALAKKYNVWFTSWEIASSAGTAGATGATSSGTTTPNSTTKDADASTQAVAPLYPPGSVQMSGGLGRTPITVGLKGEYFSLEKYLRAMQRFAVLSQKRTVNNGRLVVIDAFNYKPSDRVAWIGGKITKLKKVKKSIFLEAELSASVYFAPPLEAPKAGGSAGTSAATPATSTSTSSTATGAATVGDLK